jgi:hypothetical protein
MFLDIFLSPVKLEPLISHTAGPMGVATVLRHFPMTMPIGAYKVPVPVVFVMGVACRGAEF